MTQTQKQLDKVQNKAILLNDMLNGANEGERIGLEGDSYQVRLDPIPPALVLALVQSERIR